jgi:hypothetical protein
MSKAAAEYEALCAALCVNESVTSGQMFGKACLKVNGKAFAAFHSDKVVFKLTGGQHHKAISLVGAELWDPSGKGRPMKEWVALPAAHAKHFRTFATEALAYVLSSQ